MTTRYCTAAPGDFATLMAYNERLNPKIVQHLIDNEQCYLVKDEETIMGYAWINWLWSEVPLLGNLFIVESHRRKGLASALLREIEKRIEALYPLLLSSTLADNTVSRAWHESNGFVPCGVLYGIDKNKNNEMFFRKELDKTSNIQHAQAH